MQTKHVIHKLAMAHTYRDPTCSYRKKVVETLSKELHLLNVSLAANGLSGYEDDLKYLCKKHIKPEREAMEDEFAGGSSLLEQRASIQALDRVNKVQQIRSHPRRHLQWHLPLVEHGFCTN